MAPPDDEPLVRGLNLPAATSVSLGAVIGSGIFIGANRVAAGVSSPWYVFLIWIAAGLGSLLGALVYAEFGASLPRSGSDYIYVKRSISPYWGFLSGWATLAVNLPASIAAIALAFGSQLESFKPAVHGTLLAPSFAIKFTAVGLIAIFTIVNYFGVRQGGNTQSVLTGLKLLLIAALIAIGLSALRGPVTLLEDRFTASHSVAGGGLAVALTGALWATDGWSGVTRVAGEVKDPQRNVPRALIIGILTVTAVYLLVNLAYLAALGFDAMAGVGDPEADRLIAARAAEAVLGPPGKVFVGLVIMVSILGALNGLTLSGPRVYFAMARDRLFFPAIARVHPVHKTPYASILFQGALSILLVLFFSFEQLTSYVVAAAWLSYMLAGIGLLRLRSKEPDLPRPYAVPMYPWTPMAFIALSLSFLVYIVVDATRLATQGAPRTLWLLLLNVAVLAASWPVYRTMRRRYHDSGSFSPT